MNGLRGTMRVQSEKTLWHLQGRDILNGGMTPIQRGDVMYSPRSAYTARRVTMNLRVRDQEHA